MREKQPSIEERILDIEMKMAETGPWPADFPATSGELGVRIRAVVREMDRESSSRTREWAKQAIMSICIDQYMRKSSQALGIDNPTPTEEKPQVPPTALGPAPYGYCPICGAPGWAKQAHGNDRCPNGHTYPSKLAMPGPYASPNYSATPPEQAPPPELAERLAREADRESSSRTREWAKQAIMSICIDQYMRKSSSPSSGMRNAEKALEGLYRDHGHPYLTPEAQAAIEQAEAHLAAANQPAEEIRK